MEEEKRKEDKKSIKGGRGKEGERKKQKQRNLLKALPQLCVLWARVAEVCSLELHV